MKSNLSAVSVVAAACVGALALSTGLTPGEALSLADGRIVNPDGGISPIVHQYDRHPALMAAMHERWGQGFEARERRRGKSLSERGRKLKESLARRLPELR